MISKLTWKYSLVNYTTAYGYWLYCQGYTVVCDIVYGIQVALIIYVGRYNVDNENIIEQDNC